MSYELFNNNILVMLARCLEFLDQNKEEISYFCIDESLYNDFTECLLETKVLYIEDVEEVAEVRDCGALFPLGVPLPSRVASQHTSAKDCGGR